MFSGVNQQQQNLNPTVLPQNTIEVISSNVDKKNKYKLPLELRGIVREEDWPFLDIEVQKKLIESMNLNPETFKESNAFESEVPHNLNNLTESGLQNPSLITNSELNKLIDETNGEFQRIKSEVIDSEKRFLDNGNKSPNTLPVEQNNLNQNNVVLTEEDKARIAEERGGQPAWLPKLFGMKPSQSFIQSATQKSRDDHSDLDIKESSSWLKVLIRKLVYMMK